MGTEVVTPDVKIYEVRFTIYDFYVDPGYSQLTTHNSQLTTHHSQLTTHD